MVEDNFYKTRIGGQKYHWLIILFQGKIPKYKIMVLVVFEEWSSLKMMVVLVYINNDRL